MEKKNKEKFEFKPMQWVLARNDENEKWTLCQFSHYIEDEIFPYSTCGGACWNKCIPYKGNKHLLGTTDPYVETKGKSEYVPKDGDFVYVKSVSGNEYVYIKANGEFKTSCYSNCLLCNDGRPIIGESSLICDESGIVIIRPATDFEMTVLLSNLHKIGKDWDAEKKQIVDWKWEPSIDETYYFPGLNSTLFKFETFWSVWYGDGMDLERKKRNFVFRTEEECQVLCEKLNDAIKDVK